MAQKIYNVVSNYAHLSSSVVSTFSKLANAVDEFNWCCKCIENDEVLKAEKNVIHDSNISKFVVYRVSNNTYMTIQLITNYIFDDED